MILSTEATWFLAAASRTGLFWTYSLRSSCCVSNRLGLWPPEGPYEMLGWRVQDLMGVCAPAESATPSQPLSLGMEGCEVNEGFKVKEWGGLGRYLESPWLRIMNSFPPVVGILSSKVGCLFWGNWAFLVLWCCWIHFGAPGEPTALRFWEETLPSASDLEAALYYIWNLCVC